MPRSHSQNQFGSAAASYHRDFWSKHSSTHDEASEGDYPMFGSSSASSPPRTIYTTELSDTSTPATISSLASEYVETLSKGAAPKEHFTCAAYSNETSLRPQNPPEDNLGQPQNPQTDNPCSLSPTDNESVDVTRPVTRNYIKYAEDDTAIVSHPSGQVDYLSHAWREEDIWSSWRYIALRRGKFPNSARLENASWRAWMKLKNNLKTIAPETLNWLKDYDIIWLYGPLKTGIKDLNPTQTEPPSQTLPKNDSVTSLCNKAILKKRSRSEIILQRPLPTAPRLQQAVSVDQAQETSRTSRPDLPRAMTHPLTFSTTAQGDGLISSSLHHHIHSSRIASPSAERKRIQFSDQVEQCIAIEFKDEDNNIMDTDFFSGESDSDDGFMMKKVKRTKDRPLKKRVTKKSAKVGGRIIATLPPTNLNYGADTHEPLDTVMEHSRGASGNQLISRLSPEERLQPANASMRCFLADEADEALKDSIHDDKSGWQSPLFEAPGESISRRTLAGSLTDESAGIRRTESSVPMPSEEGHSPASATGYGVFDRVIDAVNTGRDMFYVIRNVGSRN